MAGDGFEDGDRCNETSIMNDAEERKKFERTRPIGYGKVLLKDFVG